MLGEIYDERRDGAPTSHGEPRRRRSAATTARTVVQIPSGWTVFEIPSTPGPMLTVGWKMCGRDQPRISVPAPWHPRQTGAAGLDMAKRLGRADRGD